MVQMSKVELALAEAQTAEDVLVICFGRDGNMAMHSTINSGPEILWALELAKSQVLEMGQEMDS